MKKYESTVEHSVMAAQNRFCWRPQIADQRDSIRKSSEMTVAERRP